MAWSTVSRHKRGYGSDWEKKRKIILKRDNGLCQCEDCRGGKLRITPATEVDHIIHKAKAKRLGWSDQRIDAEENLQAINSECHKGKTLKEEGKTLKPKTATGFDGYPTDRGG